MERLFPRSRARRSAPWQKCVNLMRKPLAEHRCPGCEIRKPLCFCEAIPRISLATKVVIVMHAAEEVLTTNTARLAAKALPNSEIRVRGRKERMPTEGLVEGGRQSWVLYPGPQARELNSDLVSTVLGPVTLIVPDGSWSQARNMVRREAALAGIPQVRLPAGPVSEYRLRNQPGDDSLCTLEAIARALGILEGEAVQSRLELLLRVMVERTLWSRGQIAAEDCRWGKIPEGAMR